MIIKIVERLHPFSHLPGACCPIPHTTFAIEAFPTLLRFKDLNQENKTIEVKLELTGPVRNFTLELDLEKSLVRIFGHAKEGYVRIDISKDDKGIALFFEKLPPQGVRCQLEGTPKLISSKEKLVIKADLPPVAINPLERLSLGMHKAQNWDAVISRLDLKEIFPIFYHLSQQLPKLDKKAPLTGTALLLKDCEDAIENKERNDIEKVFLNLLQAGFYGILVPRLFDCQYQGLAPAPTESDLSALILLQEGGAQIRSLFFQEDKEILKLLPCLPTKFDCGRFIDIKTNSGDRISMEWSKKLLKGVVIHPNERREVRVELQKALKSYRVRSSMKERGKVFQRDDVLLLEPGKKIFLDRFEK